MISEKSAHDHTIPRYDLSVKPPRSIVLRNHEDFQRVVLLAQSQPRATISTKAVASPVPGAKASSVMAATFDAFAPKVKIRADAQFLYVESDGMPVGPQYPGGFAGHTLSVCGYLAAENLYVLCNPAVASPGLQLITAADLKNFWRSDYYGSRAKAVLSRPTFVIEMR